MLIRFLSETHLQNLLYLFMSSSELSFSIGFDGVSINSKSTPPPLPPKHTHTHTLPLKWQKTKTQDLQTVAERQKVKNQKRVIKKRSLRRTQS